MTGLRTNPAIAVQLPVDLDRTAGPPLHRQIETAVREAVRSGRLPLGTVLPSTRSLAGDLGITRGVVVEAYRQLTAEGYLSSRPGGYTRVAVGPPPVAPPAPPPAGPPPLVDFGYGRSDAAHFPRALWLRSLRRVLTGSPSERLNYLSGRGAPELHEALADYLNRVRGTAARPDAVVVCNGYAQGIGLLVQVLAASGARRLAVEDPSPGDDAVPVARAAGMEIAGIPVGPDGVDVAALERSDADAVVLTPSHQWPTGAVLSPESRVAVLDWARRRDALIVEDDYDAEFRYDRAPLAALQGMAPDRVVYAGSASKTLAPGLRMGWLLAPPRLVGRLAAAKELADRGSPAVEQLAFADFLVHGEFERHLRRMRPQYRRRRDALLAALGDRLPELEPAGIAAGMHLVCWLPPGLDEAAVVGAAARRGLRIHGVGPYRLGSAGPGGLIFGYAVLSEPAIAEGVRLLAAAVADVRRG